MNYAYQLDLIIPLLAGLTTRQLPELECSLAAQRSKWTGEEVPGNYHAPHPLVSEGSM